MHALSRIAEQRLMIYAEQVRRSRVVDHDVCSWTSSEPIVAVPRVSHIMLFGTVSRARLTEERERLKSHDVRSGELERVYHLDGLNRGYLLV